MDDSHEVPAIVSDTWDIGIAKLKSLFIADTNEVMSRYHLF